MLKKILSLVLLISMSFALHSQEEFNGEWPEGYSCCLIPYQVHSETEGVASLAGYTTYRMYIQCVNPTDRVTIVYGIEGLETHINFTGDLFQQAGPLGGPTPAIPCSFYDDVAISDPEAIYDSYVCIGMNCNANANPETGESWIPAQPIGVDWAEAFEEGENITINSETGGSWFSIGDADASKNTWAGEDLKVQIGQFTTNGDIFAELTFTIFPEGELGMSTYNVYEAPCSNLEGIAGCTETDACNYDPEAVISNSSCLYECSILMDGEITANATCPYSANGSVNIDVSGNQSGTLFELADGSVSDSGIFTGLLPGIYTYNVTDESSLECGGEEQCIVEGTFTIGPLDFEAEMDISQISCYEEESGEICIVEVTGGTEPYLYDCNSDGIFDDDACISDLQNGNYDIAIQDDNGCLFEQSFDLVNPEPIAAESFSTNSQCGNDSDGTIDLCETSGGTGDYSYSIDGGSTFTDNCEFENLSGGSYPIVVMDEEGCSISLDEIEIEEPDVIEANLEEIIGATWDPITESYVIDMLGYLEFTADGGTGTLSFFWHELPAGYVAQPNASSNYLENLIAGQYCVTISDAIGCSYIECFTVDQIIGVDEIIDNVALSLYPNPSQGDFMLFMDGLNGEKLSYTIIDGMGRVVASVDLGNRAGRITEEIDISTEANGFYYLQLNVDGSMKTLKLIKED